MLQLKISTGAVYPQMTSKESKSSEATMASETKLMLFEGTIEGAQWKPLPRKESHFIMSLQLLSCFIICIKLKITTLKQIREATCPW